MNGEAPGKLTMTKFSGARRKAVSVSQESLVRTSPLDGGNGLPLVVEPAVQGLKLTDWATTNRDTIDGWIKRHGGVLFRGFDVPTPEAFQEAVRAVSGDLLEYKERSSPRHAVSGKVYTSTDYPPDQPIFLHNENSYQNTWPMRIFFYCHVEPGSGGETPIADTRRIFEEIDPEIRRRFLDKGWMYVRNFGDGFGLEWQTVFQTDDRSAVEAYCAQSGIEVEWKDGGRLRTRARRPAAVEHPQTGEMVWFNHATFFHVTTLDEAIREALLSEFDEQDLPTNTYYGDGSPIEPEVLETLRGLYHRHTVKFPWRKGDLLALDNMLVAHGREPFEGQRQILVGMADPMTWDRMPA